MADNVSTQIKGSKGTLIVTAGCGGPIYLRVKGDDSSIGQGEFNPYEINALIEALQGALAFAKRE